MSVRSPGLLALSVALLVASGSLAYVLEHDGVGQAPVLAQAAPGEQVTVKGILETFLPRAGSATESARWAEVARHLDNFTHALDTGAADQVILLTSPGPGPGPGASIVTTGSVLLRGWHPDGSGRTLVLVHASDLSTPILFR